MGMPRLEQLQRGWLRMPAIESAVAPIVRLLCGCRPSAIVGRVWPVVVASVDRMARRRTWPHIGEEVFEVVSPSVADHDSASTVLSIVRRARVQAAVLQPFPRVVLDRAALSVSAVRCARLLRVEAPARRRLLTEMVLANGCQSAAITSTCPRPVPGRCPRGLADHRQPSKPLPGHVFQRSHAEHFTAEYVINGECVA